MAKRPHRRDRRKPAPNRPGGAVFGLSVLRDTQSWAADEIIVAIDIASATDGTPGFTNLDLVAGDVADLTGWNVFDDGVATGLDGVTIDPDGVLEIRLSTDATGNAYLIVPAFVPELTSVSGITCAGGILYHEY